MNAPNNCPRDCQVCGAPPACDSNENGVCCIDTYRIFDSCRSQDCIENTLVHFTDIGQQAVNDSVSVRTKSVKVLWTRIDTVPTPFNAGYYQVNIRYYFYVLLDCCLGLGNTQEVQGLAIHDKTVILYGGEGNVSSFRSDIRSSLGCGRPDCELSVLSNLPRVIVEVADPMALRLEVTDGDFRSPMNATSVAEGLPAQITDSFNGSFNVDCRDNTRNVFITIGAFSIIRIERPSQLVIPACDICIPPSCDRKLESTDPCTMFRSLDFPIREFYPSSAPVVPDQPASCPGEKPLDPAEYQ